MLSLNTSVDLSLPSYPSTEIKDPVIFEELLKIYNAIRSVALGLDEYTQGGLAAIEGQLDVLVLTVRLSEVQKSLTQIAENVLTLNTIPTWGQPGEIGSVVSNTGKFTTFGANGKEPSVAIVLPANATDAASTQALANAIKAALITFGLGA